MCSVSFAEGVDYFIDFKNGNDRADGRSEESAWSTLENINSKTFGPGDKLLFKAGERWVGELLLRGTGTEEHPIRVGRYGDGPAPHIAGDGKTEAAVVLQNGAHWLIEDLEVTNTLPNGKRKDKLKGVLVLADEGGVFKNITLRRLYVHDVSGGWDRHGGAGIWVKALDNQKNTGNRKSRFDGVLIEDCYVHDVSFYGIIVSAWENRFRGNDWFPNQNVVIRNNFTRDTGGDSIVVIACENALIEHNEAHRCAIGQLHTGQTHAAGIWPHSSDGTIMRYNKVVDIQASKDGQAFDVDINCRNTLLEYNWSQLNENGFLLLCSPDDELPGTSGVIVRNNISIDDGKKLALFKFVSDVRDVRIENNVFLNSFEQPQRFMHTWRPKQNKGWELDVVYENNIFSTPGAFLYEDASFVVPSFTGNTYAGEFLNWPADHLAIRAEHPAAKIQDGTVVGTSGGSSFKPFEINKAGLLPTSSWRRQRNASLEQSLQTREPRV